MTSSDKMAAGRSDVSVPVATSRRGEVASEKTEMTSPGVDDEVDQQRATSALSSIAQSRSVVASSASPSLHASAGNDDDSRTGNGSRNPHWAQAAGRFRQDQEKFRPNSTAALFRARTVGAVAGRYSCDAAFDCRTPVTISAGSYSSQLRKAAAVSDGGSRLPEASTADHSSVVSWPALADRLDESQSSVSEAAPLQELVRPSTTLPGRSSRDAAAQVQQASTSTMETGANAVQMQAARTSHLTIYRSVSGPHRSVTGCSEKTAVRTSATVDGHATSVGQRSAPGDTVAGNAGSRRASASPQLRRWKTGPECGGQSSAAAQAADMGHHPGHKPHSVPCSPRLRARLAATQPWRPWSPPSTSGARVAARPFQTAYSGSGLTDLPDVSQLASSLLLAKVIRDRQKEERSRDLKWHGNHTSRIENVQQFDNKNAERILLDRIYKLLTYHTPSYH